MTRPAWKAYEAQISERLRSRAAPDAEVRFDEHGKLRLPGRFSGVPRQIDVLVEGRFAGLSGMKSMVVDCKCWRKEVSIETVEAFGGLVDDVKADLGLIVTTRGFTPAARSRAAGFRGIDIDVVEFDELAAWLPRRPTVAMTGDFATVTYREVNASLPKRFSTQLLNASRRSTGGSGKRARRNSGRVRLRSANDA